MLDYQLLTHSLIVAVVLFALGMVGFVTRRNLVVMIVSSAIMLQGVVLALTSFSTFHADEAGDVFSVFAVITTIVQAVLMLSMMFAIARSGGSLDVSCWKNLGEGANFEQTTQVKGDFEVPREPRTAGADSATTNSASANGDAMRGAGH